ncbi:protein of unknown function [Nitrospira japonica]|uniref:Uncharacterized protein n=1 Tax=Nitrospira japonica TaxID=1325564 RepID=A0A1W1I3C0_9BACT|nr:protein of unknown function [Nitrospira japonica]
MQVRSRERPRTPPHDRPRVLFDFPAVEAETDGSRPILRSTRVGQVVSNGDNPSGGWNARRRLRTDVMKKAEETDLLCLAPSLVELAGAKESRGEQWATLTSATKRFERGRVRLRSFPRPVRQRKTTVS